jgi:hypothetical protein
MSSATVSAKVVEQLTGLLTRLASKGWVAGAEFSYWDRGGPPGPGYESNYLQLWGDDRVIHLRCTKTRFDELAPPYRVEQYDLDYPQPQPVLFAEIVEKKLFTRAFAEETPLPIGGVTKLTFAVTDGSDFLEKTFYGQVPPELEPLKNQLEELMLLCERQGKKTVLSKEE